jgi:hypothetical protein
LPPSPCEYFVVSFLLDQAGDSPRTLTGHHASFTRCQDLLEQTFFGDDPPCHRLVSSEEFQSWFRTRSRFPIAIKGHTFALSRDGLVKVDGGKFIYEEALQLVSMLYSRNPLTQLNASLIIWERNGVLRFLVLALVVIVVAAVLIIARR